MARNRLVGLLIAALVGSSILAHQTSAVAVAGSSSTRWIVHVGALDLVQALDPRLASLFWNSAQTNIQNSADTPSSQVPAGWASIPDQKFTAYGSCSGTGDPSCTSFTTDVDNGSIKSSAIPVVMYDNESWTATPSNESSDPCSFMQQFAGLAHTKGFTTIMAPAQDLVSVNTPFMGGESQSWQAFMRLGYPACAVSGGGDRYHIQAQANQEDPDFTAFTTQAMLQAKGANPNVVVTTGLATNRGTGDVPTPQRLYQDSIDAQNVGAAGFWLNIPGGGARPDNAVQYLELMAGMLPFYAHAGGRLDTTYPAGTTASTFSLGTVGTSLTSVSSQTFAAGTVIPAGTYKFEDFTDGSSGSAGLGLEFGYCVASSCASSHTPIIGSGSWSDTVHAADAGPTSTFTTTSSTTLPAGGPYSLYAKVTVTSAGSFNLADDSSTAETNLAIPRPSALPAPSPGTSVFFPHGAGAVDGSLPTGSTASRMSLATAGASRTWTTAQTYPAGTVVPAGRWLFQPWTDGSSGTAQLGVELGYCTASSCGTSRTAIASWNPTVTAGSRGDNLDSGGNSAHTTRSSTTLPAGGPYSLYLKVSVVSAGSFNLQFDSATTATNLATPFYRAPGRPPARVRQVLAGR